MFPDTPTVLRRVGLIATLAAASVTLPAGAQAAGGADLGAKASASATLQAQAHLSAVQVQRLAASSGTRARAALNRSQVQLRHAATLAIVVATEAAPRVAGDAAAHFAASTAGDIGLLSDVSGNAEGRLAIAAAQAVRQDVRLAATVNAALTARDDLSSEGSISASLAAEDKASVDVVGRLAVAIGESEGRAQSIMRQALGAALAVRTAIVARVSAVVDTAENSGRTGLTQAATAMAEGTATINQAVSSTPGVTVDAHGSASIGVDQGGSGAGVVADVVAHLDAGTSRLRAAGR